MGLAKNEFFPLFFMAFLGFTISATVYKVGESAGCTVAGNVDYGRWASSKLMILFFSNSTRSITMCSSQQPGLPLVRRYCSDATYSTGNDSFFIRSSGHYFFFFCGFLGHCQAGQKVDIRVPKYVRALGAPIGSIIQPPQASPNGPMEQSPSSILCFNKIWLLLLFLMWDLFNGFLYAS